MRKLVLLLMAILMGVVIGATSGMSIAPHAYATTTMVDEWVDSMGTPMVPTINIVPAGDTLPNTCSGVADDMALFYCAPEIYIGESMFEYMDSVTPELRYTLIAHEYTHHYQQVNGAQNWMTEVEREVHAACGMGVFNKWAMDQGLIDQSTIDATLDIMDLPDDGVHGTPTQKNEAYALGYASTDLSGCESFLHV